jgi:hypothetical protein
VKNENGDLLADSHNILESCKKCFAQLLNVHSVSDVRKTKTYKTEPLVPGPSRLEVEIVTENWNKYKWLGSVEITAEMIQAGGEMLLSPIHKLISSI